MSLSTACQTSSTPSLNVNSILDAALSEYTKKTGGGLLEHPLAEEVKRCDSIGAISAILRGQAREFQQFRDGDHRLMKWINPMVDVLSTFSETLGGVANIVRPRNPVITIWSVSQCYRAGVPPCRRRLYWDRCTPFCPYLRCRYSWTLFNTDIV
jgi:hypothetical protein